MTDSIYRNGNGRLRMATGVVTLLLGFFIFLVGSGPWLFGLDRSPITGVVQIVVFMIGLGLICIGGYVSLASLWNGYQKTIAADIGLRLVGTGYVIALASGMADIFGFGSQPLPFLPHFGTLQAAGVMVGQAVIGLGFILMIPIRPTLSG